MSLVRRADRVLDPTDPRPPWLQIRERRLFPLELAPAILRTFGVTQPPVQVHALALELGCQVFDVTDFDTVTKGAVGALVVQGKTPQVMQRIDSNPWRKRFTVAHELGHLFLHTRAGRRQFVDTTCLGSDIETQANRFAVDLLLPLDLIRRAGTRDPDCLSMLFGVSPSAMNIRLERLEPRRWWWPWPS